MYVEQLYTGCLAEAAYYVESEGVAAVIDPLRETQPYVELARSRGAKIKYIFETHFHADFVSGHVDLARETGAIIVYGPNAVANFDIYSAKDGDVFDIGKVQIKVLHSPGHTMESSCFLLIDEKGKDHAVFTGDTLFIGDVGRPDLAVKTDLSREDLARYLYDSIHTKLMPLADDVIIYPGHGAGSQCGKKLSDETHATLGHEKKFNYALQPMEKEEFVKVVTDGLESPPAYFPENARINKEGYTPIKEVMEKNVHPLTLDEFEKEMELGAEVIDTREQEIFEKGFIPGAINIGLDGMFAVWVGTILHINQPIILVTDPGKEEEAVLRLARVGFENVKGYLKGSFDAWKDNWKEVHHIDSVKPQDLAGYLKHGWKVLDVRRPSERHEVYIKDSINHPLNELEEDLKRMDDEMKYIINCKGGYRSIMAASILKKHGFKNILNLYGGIDELKKTHPGFLETTELELA